MPTIRQYLDQLKWTQADLARVAELDSATVKRAIRGLPVQPRTLRAIARAISKGLGEKVTPRHLTGVRIFGHGEEGEVEREGEAKE
jgi:transcriptional regulator with XRE-family HTH domain